MEHYTTESNVGDNNYNETKNAVGNNFLREGKALNGNNRYLKRLMKSKSVCNLNFKELERRMTSSCSNLKTFEEEEEAMNQPYRRKKSVTFDEPQIQGVLNYPAEPKNFSFLKGDKMKTFNKMFQKTLNIGKIKTYTKKNLLKKMNSSYNESNKNCDNDDTTEESLNRNSVGSKDHHLNPDKLNRNISSSMPDLKSDFVVYRTSNYDNDNDMNSVRSISSTSTNTTSKIKNMAVMNVKKIKKFHPKNTVKALRKAVYKPKDQRLRNTFPSRSYDDILRENNYPTQAEYLCDNSKDEQYECGNFDDDEQYYNVRRTSAFSSTVDDKNIDDLSLQKRCSTIEEEINKIIEDSKNIKKDKENENQRMSNFIPKIEIISPEAPVVETVSEGSRESFNKTDTLSDRNYRRKKIRQKGTKLKRNTNSTNSSCSSFEERKFFQSLHKIVTQTSSASSSEGRVNAKEIVKNQSDDKIYVSGPTRENDLPPTGSPQSYSLIKKVQKLHARVNLFRSVSDFGPLPSTPPPPKPPRSYKLIEKKDSLSRPTDIDAGFRRYSLVDTDYGYLSSYTTRSLKKETSYTFAGRPIYDTQSSDENSCTYKRFSWNSSSDESSHYDFIERASSSFGDDNYLEGDKKSTSPLLDNSEEEWGHCSTSNASSSQYLDAQYLTPPSSPYIRKDIRKMVLQRSQNSSSLNTLNISESPKDIVLLKRSISDITSQNNSKNEDENEKDKEKTETFKLNEEKETDPLSRKDKVVLGLFFQKLIEKENELKSSLSTSIAEEGSVVSYNDNTNFNEVNSKDVSDSNNNDKGECETLDSAERTSFENEENHVDKNFEASCTPPLYGIVMNNEMGLELFWPIRRNIPRKNSGWTSEPEIGSSPKDFRSNRRFSSSVEYISSENDSMMVRY